MRRADPFGEGGVAAAARRRRSLAIALGLVLLVVLIFAVTAVRLAQNTAAQRAGSTTGALR